ncbi:uncharacterized protein LOC128963042 [Oppia nitens]|uniref:uncharacterized protein LOC128963042 n=1 Tax=Oppia nitens TaxID=1686743 RepID=UPI0023DBE207|nr:uncharacterized protein LOC128963042 [Oppia nitens]
MNVKSLPTTTTTTTSHVLNDDILCLIFSEFKTLEDIIRLESVSKQFGRCVGQLLANGCKRIGDMSAKPDIRLAIGCRDSNGVDYQCSSCNHWGCDGIAHPFQQRVYTLNIGDKCFRETTSDDHNIVSLINVDNHRLLSSIVVKLTETYCLPIRSLALNGCLIGFQTIVLLVKCWPQLHCLVLNETIITNDLLNIKSSSDIWWTTLRHLLIKRLTIYEQNGLNIYESTGADLTKLIVHFSLLDTLTISDHQWLDMTRMIESLPALQGIQCLNLQHMSSVSVADPSVTVPVVIHTDGNTSLNELRIGGLFWEDFTHLIQFLHIYSHRLKHFAYHLLRHWDLSFVLQLFRSIVEESLLKGVTKLSIKHTVRQPFIYEAFKYSNQLTPIDNNYLLNQLTVLYLDNCLLYTSHLRYLCAQLANIRRLALINVRLDYCQSSSSEQETGHKPNEHNCSKCVETNYQLLSQLKTLEVFVVSDHCLSEPLIANMKYLTQIKHLVIHTTNPLYDHHKYLCRVLCDVSRELGANCAKRNDYINVYVNDSIHRLMNEFLSDNNMAIVLHKNLKLHVINFDVCNLF